MEDSKNHATLLVLQNDVKHLTDAFVLMRDDLKEWQSRQEGRIISLETDQVRIETQLDHQRRRGTLADIGAFGTALIAGVVGIFAKQP